MSQILKEIQRDALECGQAKNNSSDDSWLDEQEAYQEMICRLIEDIGGKVVCYDPEGFYECLGVLVKFKTSKGDDLYFVFAPIYIHQVNPSFDAVERVKATINREHQDANPCGFYDDDILATFQL